MGDITYAVGIPEGCRTTAAELYDQAFGQKLGPAIRDRAHRLDVLAAGLDLSKAIGAFDGPTLVGLAGMHDRSGSLTGGIRFGMTRRRIGFLRAVRAFAVFALLDRSPGPDELLMDGIVVAEVARGRGIGTGLFAELERWAIASGFATIRLDVVDTNPDARRLYERLGFRPVKTERAAFLRPFMGFGASTTMVKDLAPAGS